MILMKHFMTRNRKLFAITLLLIVVSVFGRDVYSQPVSDTSGVFDKTNFKEQLYIKTDRNIYIAGEQVWFKVYELSGLTKNPENLSKVIYLELLDKNNFPLKQLKVKADNGSGSSVMILPDNISSGNYLLRAYTSWMENFPVGYFYYTAISVINPFESIDHIKLSANISKSDSVTQISPNADNSFTNSWINNKIIYSISLDRKSYTARSNVKFVISATDLSGKPVESDLSVSVTRSALISNQGFNTPEVINKPFKRISPKEYLAELEGHIISGHIRQKTTDEPLKNIDVSLSFVGKIAKCHFTKTDENGDFNFLINEQGLNEIVIQPLSPDITGYYIELSQPFSSSFLNLKLNDFFIDSSKLNGINKAIVSAQVTNIYQPFTDKQDESHQVIPDFFGKPENSVKMSDYIELTTVREVVKEIIPNVTTQRQNGKYDFKLINKFRGQPFENRPLVLMDGIPVYDFEKVLSISSKEIERVDVINTRYFYSGNVFDGILSFITKKGNLSAIEFDNSIFRQVYEGCQVPKYFYSPEYSKGIKKDGRLADFRNTLLWKPDLRTDKDGKAEVSFYTSDESSEYTIIVEGISKDGKTGSSSTQILVK